MIIGTHYDQLPKNEREDLQVIMQEVNAFFNIPPFRPGTLYSAKVKPQQGG